MQSYVLKADRGRAVHSNHMLGLDYWVDRNFNTDEDRSILALMPKVRPIRAAFATDPILAGLHDKAVAWRHARFDKLMQKEPFRALFGRLLMTPPSKPLALHQAQVLLKHATTARTSGTLGDGAKQA